MRAIAIEATDPKEGQRVTTNKYHVKTFNGLQYTDTGEVCGGRKRDQGPDAKPSYDCFYGVERGFRVPDAVVSDELCQECFNDEFRI